MSPAGELPFRERWRQACERTEGEHKLAVEDVRIYGLCSAIAETNMICQKLTLLSRQHDMCMLMLKNMSRDLLQALRQLRLVATVR